MIIQSRSKGTGRQAGSGSRTGRMVGQAASESGQARVKARRARKEKLEKASAETQDACRLEQIRRTGRQKTPV